MKKVARIICVMTFCLVAMIGMSNVSDAATVGQSLTAPEEGWQRFDNTNPNIQYIGSSWISGNYPSYYLNTVHLNFDSKDCIVKFKFMGTKLRIMGVVHPDYTGNLKIKVDNTEYLISQKGDQVGGALNFEKIGMSSGVHNVTISKSDAKFIAFDAIDIDEAGYLIPIYQVTNLKATKASESAILKWDQIPEASSYIVRYGENPSSLSMTKTLTAASYDHGVIEGLTDGTKYYFTVSAVVNAVTKEASNMVSVVPESESSYDYEGNSAILEIIMTNGTIKEYSLTNTELEFFLTWYDNRSDGTGKSYYRIPKKSNIKPFLSRKEYLSFDKIYSFEVKDYND